MFLWAFQVELFSYLGTILLSVTQQEGTSFDFPVDGTVGTRFLLPSTVCSSGIAWRDVTSAKENVTGVVGVPWLQAVENRFSNNSQSYLLFLLCF